MPNIPIVDLSVTCPSDCSLIGTASVMRDFLLGKNLPATPFDIITAGYESEWYNDGDVATQYDNLDPLTLVDTGTVLDSIEQFRTQHKNINIYDDYDPDHYDNYGNYTEYPLISIDDSILTVTLSNFGNIQSWTDPDEALINIDTWETKWVMELNNNKFNPSSTYFNISALPNHNDNVVPDISILTLNTISSFIVSLYNISSFTTPDDASTLYTPVTYNQTFLESKNKYKQTAADSYISSYFYLSYYNYADPSLSDPNLIVNQTNDDIDHFTDKDGLNIFSFLSPTPQGIRDWYNVSYNDYSISGFYNPTGNGFYSNGNINFMPVNDTSDGFLPNNDLKQIEIDNIDSFTLDLPEFSSLGFQTGEPLTPIDIRSGYCTFENIFGGSQYITEDVDVLPSDANVYQYNTTPKVLNCYSYITSITDPFTYGIQDSKEITTNLLNLENLLDDFLPPQATINIGLDTPMDLIHYGITSNIQDFLGFVFPNMPVPLDAVLNLIDKNTKDTPLGKTAKVKLASEFFNRIALNIRQDAYGAAEGVATGLKQMAGNLISSVVGSDKKSPNGLDTIVDAFQNHEITVPKSIIGKAANLISSLGGVNLKLDPIQESISWTANVPKNKETSTDFNDMPTVSTRSFWNKLTGLGSVSKTNDPSQILLAYTSAGQKDFISASLQLNEYEPYYQLAGMTNEKAIQKKQKKLDSLTKRISKDKSKLDDYNKRINEIDDHIEKISTNSPEYQNKIKRLSNGRFSKDPDPQTSSINFLIQQEQKDKDSLQLKVDAVTQDKIKCEKAKTQLDVVYPLTWYPQFDDGSFNGSHLNSGLKSMPELEDTYQVNIPGSNINSQIDYAESNVSSTDVVYTNPIYDDTNVCRYKKDLSLGLAPDSEDYSYTNALNIYDTVNVLLKHGVKPDNTDQKDLRGLNINSLDQTAIGYNVYPVLDGGQSILHNPGLGREDIYEGQSLFSVLESNGYVKVSPLWSGDHYGDTQIDSVKSKRKMIENGAGNSDSSEDYQEKTKIHRYMFSLENLAWKGYSQMLPWWERGANGGRVMWFPPYDIRVTDTTSVSLGQETLIGRNEPVYTYNHTERSGVLSFKLIMDFPGYSNPDTEYIKPSTDNTTTQTNNQQTTDSMTVLNLTAPEFGTVDWDITPDTYMYIFMDTSGSMKSYNDTILSLFIGDGAILRNKLIEDGIYTADEYQKHVFVFEDKGVLKDPSNSNSDNIDDGRFLSWFSTPYFMTQGGDSLINTFMFDSVSYTSDPMIARLKEGLRSNNMTELNNITSVENVICIAILNDCTPAYTVYNSSTNDIVINGTGGVNENTGRLYGDAADYVVAKETYDKFKGIILGYDWVDNIGSTYNDTFDLLTVNLFGYIITSGGTISTTNIDTLNNINVQNPPQYNWVPQFYKIDWNPTLSALGNFTNTYQTLPQVKDFGDIKYILEIGSENNVVGTTDGGFDSVNNIIYLLKKALAVDSSADMAQVVKKEYTNNQLPDIRKYMKRMASDSPTHNGVTDMFVWNDGNSTPLTNTEVEKIIGEENPSDDNKYDVELNKLFIKGRNKKSIYENCDYDVYVDMTTTSGISGDTLSGGITTTSDCVTIFYWLQQIAGSSNIDDKGNVTSDGVKNILKYINGGKEPSNDSTNVTGTLTLPKSSTANNDIIKWGIDVDNMYPDNQLNEFLYFKRLDQMSPIYSDKFREKITYFDPAFHSITPVGFNNRLNFLEQCARQGPSINNTQTSDGTIIAASSNLAFGRPPVSILRIGDFYHTRIMVEGVDLAYEPLVFDMNPEGIGVQPMIVDVTINFKYIGGSSLSGPITQLQNAVSNNYFANVEFYNTSALKAFDRFKKQVIVTDTPKDVDIYTNNLNSGSIGYEKPQGSDATDQNTNNQQSSTNNNTNNTNSNNKPSNTAAASVNACPVCPDGYTLYDGTKAPYNEIMSSLYKLLCIPNTDLNKTGLPDNYIYTGNKPCRTPNTSELNDAQKLSISKGLGAFTDETNLPQAAFVTKCKSAGCS